MTNETEFIASLRALATHPAARDLEDDCTILEIGDETLVLTHDTMVEGTHFLPTQDPADVAWKLVATNLSDLAAKGAEPIGTLLSYTLSDDNERFLEGLQDALETYSLPLLGGDTVSGKGQATHGLTAIGRATHTPVPSRSEARAGDRIYVTGTLGRAMLAFEHLDGPLANTEAYRRPIPLLAEGQALAPHVTAMMDISDGLLLDCWRMAKASSLAFRLDRAAIPVADQNRFAECIRWGDDYQLLFTLPVGTACPVQATQIGHVAEGTASLHLDDEKLNPEDRLGYRHR